MKLKNIIHLLFPVLLLIIFSSVSSCKLDNRTDEFREQEKQEIQKFLSENDTLDFELKPSGLYYLDTEVGTGVQVDIYDTLHVLYTARFLSGTMFDTCVGEDTLDYVINEYYTIPGFHEGLMYMKEGGKALFLIPSGLGFGPNEITYQGYKGPVKIPGFTPFVFDVEILSIDEYDTAR
ncbi:MAG: FKBP-type peptidyl-prolyl cis-trans isomerase [Bacteroidales bacterium]|jgi:FKBP-type peptidyl-prolyl cis-trans isomerase FkpA|nr:FKBP-type peptidyl-prolyl cis-trans isomerase [Bacteroidales bacterium]